VLRWTAPPATSTKRRAAESRARRNWAAIGNTEEPGDGIVLVLSDESSDDTSAFAALVEQVVGLMSYPVVTRVSRR
jgi:hypothetical protein